NALEDPGVEEVVREALRRAGGI
ncbi:MAG: hypothetical protein HY770_06990, partial [Chitinivibrionia bacterium]|nr:hypothetical protein [Chitinivibrionia bacterium]